MHKQRRHYVEERGLLNVGVKREHPQENAWLLDDAAQWELLFQGEEALWRSAAALSAAAYNSVLSLTQDLISGSGSTPRQRNQVLALTREPWSRGMQHIRMLIPNGIKGLSENDRVTLQAWLELVDWTGKNASPYIHEPRKIGININPSGLLNSC